MASNRPSGMPRISICVLLALAAGTEAKNCTATSLACKPSCSPMKDALGGAAPLTLQRLCKLCKCQACEACHNVKPHADVGMTVLQHPGPFTTPAVRRAVKKTARSLGGPNLWTDRSKGNGVKRNKQERRWPKSGMASNETTVRGRGRRRGAGKQDGGEGEGGGKGGGKGGGRGGGSGAARARNSAAFVPPPKIVAPPDPLGDFIGHVLLATAIVVFVAMLLLFLAHVARQLSRPLVEVHEPLIEHGGGLSDPPSPIGASPQASPIK